MKLLFTALPFVLGAAAVLQAGLNRQVARQWDFTGAALTNSVVLAIVSLTTALILRPRIDLQTARWWYFVPGILGFCLVLGIPLAISKNGALRVFVGIVGAQLVASMAWDAYVESISVNSMRVIGAVLTFAGVILTWRASGS